jgi:drug/metabolite transporter (DMT)-like permease
MAGGKSKGSGAAPLLDDETTSKLSSLEVAAPAAQSAEDKKGRTLLIAFGLMLFAAVANRVFSILQYQQTGMENYPLFVNLLITFLYVPFSLMYCIPVVYGCGRVKARGWTAMEAERVPQFKWAIMGLLDSIAGVLQAIASSQLSSNGGLVNLLMQAAIPTSMVITRIFLKTKYSNAQYVGAVIVTAGIAIVLGPAVSSGGDASVIAWAAMIVGSCVFMTASSVYKEKALGDVEIDPI